MPTEMSFEEAQEQEKNDYIISNKQIEKILLCSKCKKIIEDE